MPAETQPMPPGSDAFDWRDGERRIVFGDGSLGRAAELAAELGSGFELLASERGLAAPPPGLLAAARDAHAIGPGPVAELSAELVERSDAPLLVAFGGGRVIDTAKAIAAVRGSRVAAIPTTLSGAEMTAVHRLPAGHEGEMTRPALVVTDPGALSGAPDETLRASAMNALAHAAEALWVDELANPVASLAAGEAIGRLAAGLEPAKGDGFDLHSLALGGLLAGYALDATGLSFHHVLSQTLVHTLGAPHAQTNAAVLSPVVEAMAERSPGGVAAIATALGCAHPSDHAELAAAAAERIRVLAGRPAPLEGIADHPDRVEEAVDAVLARSGQLGRVADPPGRDELRALIERIVRG